MNRLGLDMNSLRCWTLTGIIKCKYPNIWYCTSTSTNKDYFLKKCVVFNSCFQKYSLFSSLLSYMLRLKVMETQVVMDSWYPVQVKRKTGCPVGYLLVKMHNFSHIYCNLYVIGSQSICSDWFAVADWSKLATCCVT